MAEIKGRVDVVNQRVYGGVQRPNRSGVDVVEWVPEGARWIDPEREIRMGPTGPEQVGHWVVPKGAQPGRHPLEKLRRS